MCSAAVVVLKRKTLCFGEYGLDLAATDGAERFGVRYTYEWKSGSYFQDQFRTPLAG